jgi:hypothetical protein
MGFIKALGNTFYYEEQGEGSPRHKTVPLPVQAQMRLNLPAPGWSAMPHVRAR